MPAFGAGRRIVQIVRVADKAAHAMHVDECDILYYLEDGLLLLAEIRGANSPEPSTAHQCLRCSQRLVRIRRVDGYLAERGPDLLRQQALAHDVEVEVGGRQDQVFDSIELVRAQAGGSGFDDELAERGGRHVGSAAVREDVDSLHLRK